MKKLISSLVLTITPLVLGAQTDLTIPERTVADFVKQPVMTETESRFEETEYVKTEPIPYPTEYQDNPHLELDTFQILQTGLNGEKRTIYTILLWSGEEIDRLIDRIEVDEPTPEIIERGTKIIWRDYNTSDAGVVSYWRKLNVRATSYDANCLGCTGRTFTGTDVHVGVCAVDPNVIRLGTTFYVPGYGLCHAEDIGGAIKGNKIDLGFEDVREGWWSTRYVDVYVMDNQFVPSLD